MKTLIRIIQFLLNEIVEIFNSIWLMIMAIGFYIALPIYALGAFLLVIFSGKWDGVIYTLILVLATFGIFLIAQFIPTILNLIMGTILNERKENKKIYEEYEQWYENVKYQEFERRSNTENSSIRNTQDKDIQNKKNQDRNMKSRIIIHISIINIQMMEELFKNLKNIFLFLELIKMEK